MEHRRLPAVSQEVAGGDADTAGEGQVQEEQVLEGQVHGGQVQGEQV